MLQTIKNILPKSVKKILILVKRKTYYQRQKKILFKRMQLKHVDLLKHLKGKDKIKVVFLAIHKSMWKVDPVFQKMLKNPLFDPEILVCPYTDYGKERMLEDMEQTYDYFTEKGYPVRKSLKVNGDWLALNEIKPDIVFFTNPHDLTHKEYYEDAYLNYLSCYVPYHHEVGSFGDNNIQHNQYFHNALWKIFSAHQESYELAKKTASNKAANVKITGFPAMESLYQLSVSNNIKSNWKTSDRRVKIIWSPHHLILERENQSNFLEYADFFKVLAVEYKDKITWAFKPHPILKYKLYEHPSWGRVKTDEYYLFWKNNEFSQLELGDYENLFLSSDAMIHDCGSFLAEYLYVKKPVLYLLNNKHTGQYFNIFGKRALNSCQVAETPTEIISFIHELLKKSVGIKKDHEVFYNNSIKSYFENDLPSDRIINLIIKEIEK